MKYIITSKQLLESIKVKNFSKLNENNKPKLSDAIESIVSQITKESNLICDVKVFLIPEDEKNEGEIYKYDVHVGINSDLLKIYNEEGVKSITKGICSGIKKIIIEWVPLKEDEIHITRYFKKCN